ncbi:alkaline phosphatase D family protein [Noviherbaspirillum galbum]|uniref:Alkaline phosphatase n=1 Tax=Noviherbaspirillum galbum TaxID=2709383 RepID=A0A6B3SU01_9BURK|nr:alkaline phosphatase D family protein [Noviherbaspirillum galbum]NEX61109.1 alkaline phosphatase [Noviherbaspirillum galbum]
MDRRQFLTTSTRLAALAALASAYPGRAISRTLTYPFSLGVASGSPRHDRIVLWTRILPDPLDAASSGGQPVMVRWEIAEDDAFRRIAGKGSVAALPELAHSVHVDAGNLQPDRWYWYRFMTADATSPVGRTRTAPAPDASVASLRLAFASCQHWEFGEYGAHRHIARSDPDLIAFLGDYIYEWGHYDLAHPPASRKRSNESFTLDQYRARYAQYKTDPNLQAAHLVAPWIVTWDDHEVANDYGNDRDERLSPNFLARRAAAYQAFYEHMPVRLSPLPAGPDRYAYMRIHERYAWGRLAQFHVLDDRQFRSYHACQTPGRGGSNTVTMDCKERLDPARTLLGKAQEEWLHDGLVKSAATWNIIAQQTLMAECSHDPLEGGEGGRFWTDGWDGYPAARQRLFDALRDNKPSNPVVLSGDVHSFFAADLKPDFRRPISADNPVIATEFCGTSVTSNSRPQARTDRYVAQNPHIAYGRSDIRGFVMMDVTPAGMDVRFQGLDDVHRADTPASTVAQFSVEAGRPGLRKG